MFAWAFGAGLIAAINPCGFAVLPGYITHFLGSDDPSRRRRGAIHGVGVGLAVTAGKLSVFAVIAAIFLAGGSTVTRVGPWAGAVMGALLVLLGLWMLAGRSLPIPMPAVRAPSASGLRGAYLFGTGYGAASLSCCLPIFIGVFGGLGGGIVGSVGGSLLLFAAYSLGVGIVLVPLFAVTGRLRDTMVVRVRRMARLVRPLGAVLLTSAGVLLLATWVPLLGGESSVSPLVRAVLGWQSWVQRVVIRFGAVFWLALGLVLLGAVLYPSVRRPGRRRAEEEKHQEIEKVVLQREIL